MKVSIAGVLIGGVVDVVSSLLAGIPFALYFASKVDPSQRVGPRASEALSAAMHANVALYSVDLVVGLICSALGGYVAAAIAKRNERLNGTLSCYLCVALGVALLLLGLDKDPRWLQLLLLIASPVLAFVGGDLRLRQRLAHTAI
jgi:hypothetical protein